MALYFECRINKNTLLLTVFFGDFAHWDAGWFLYPEQQQKKIIGPWPKEQKIELTFEKLRVQIQPVYIGSVTLLSRPNCNSLNIVWAERISNGVSFWIKN